MRSAALVAAALFLAVGCAPGAQEAEGNGSSDALIVGGTTASIAEWEGMIQTESREGPHCGATLIAPQWAVSASHCIVEELGARGGLDRVVLGRQSSTSTGGEIIDVDRVIKHENYDPETTQNDIALLHLTKRSKQKPVRLVTPAEWRTMNKVGASVTVIGWGATSEGAQMSTTLREVTVGIINNTTCNRQYKGVIDNRQVCAGLAQGGKDSCQGDSGGPLFQVASGQKIQVGIVSFGQGCAQAGFSGVYTAVAAFRDWIATNTDGAVPATSGAVDEDVDTAEPNGAGDDASQEEATGSATDEPEDMEEDEDSTPASKKKAPRKKTLVTTSGCDMTRSRGPTGSTAARILAAAALVGLLLRRARRAGDDRPRKRADLAA